MTERHDVVIVGGGIMGASALFEFARRGVDALLLESEPTFGGRDSSKTAGIVRTQYSNPDVVRIAIRGRQLYRDFPVLTGAPPVFNQIGHIFLSPPELLDLTRQNVAMQVAEGTEVEEMPADRISEFVPVMAPDGIGAIFSEPGSGYVDAVPAGIGYIEGARRHGATARSGIGADRLRIANGKVVGVDTADGPILADAVVIAAGAGSKALAATAGLELPMEFSVEQELLVETAADDAPRVSVSNAVDACYMRPEYIRHVPEGRRAVLLGRGFPKDYPAGDPTDYPAQQARPDLTRDLLAHIAIRTPTIAAARLLEPKVALYDITPDWHPLLGPTEALPGVLLITGGSGHGFKLAPAFAEMVVGDYVGEPVAYASVADFSLDRFAHGNTFGSIYGGNRA